MKYIGMSTSSCHPCSIILFVYFLALLSLIHSKIDFLYLFVSDYKSAEVAFVFIMAALRVSSSYQAQPVGKEHQKTTHVCGRG